MQLTAILLIVVFYLEHTFPYQIYFVIRDVKDQLIVDPVVEGGLQVEFLDPPQDALQFLENISVLGHVHRLVFNHLLSLDCNP